MALAKIVREEFLKVEVGHDFSYKSMDEIIETLKPYIRKEDKGFQMYNLANGIPRSEDFSIPSIPAARLLLFSLLKSTKVEGQKQYNLTTRAAFEYLEGTPNENVEYIRNVIISAGLQPKIEK